MKLPSISELQNLRDRLRETNDPELVQIGNGIGHIIRNIEYYMQMGIEMPEKEKGRVLYLFRLGERKLREKGYESRPLNTPPETPDITVQRGKVVIRFDDYENVISIKGKSIRVEINFEI